MSSPALQLAPAVDVHGRLELLLQSLASHALADQLTLHVENFPLQSLDIGDILNSCELI